MKINTLLDKIAYLLENARSKVLVAVNQTMVLTYFEIGRMIVEEEQNGNNRAEYGKQIFSEVSKNLTQKFGKGFSETNLRSMRNFFLMYSNSVNSLKEIHNKVINNQSVEIQ